MAHQPFCGFICGQSETETSWSKMITLLQGDQNSVRSLRCSSCLRKHIHASDIFLHCLKAEGHFGTESPETYADVLTITHASNPGQTVGTRTGEI